MLHFSAVLSALAQSTGLERGCWSSSWGLSTRGRPNQTMQSGYKYAKVDQIISVATCAKKKTTTSHNQEALIVCDCAG